MTDNIPRFFFTTPGATTESKVPEYNHTLLLDNNDGLSIDPDRCAKLVAATNCVMEINAGVETHAVNAFAMFKLAHQYGGPAITPAPLTSEEWAT